MTTFTEVEELQAAQVEQAALDQEAMAEPTPGIFERLAAAGTRLDIARRRHQAAQQAEAARTAQEAARQADADRKAAVLALQARRGAWLRDWESWAAEMATIDSRLSGLWQKYHALQAEREELFKAGNQLGADLGALTTPDTASRVVAAIQGRHSNVNFQVRPRTGTIA